MEWGVSGGWADEALADYPKLPKSFTNAKTAKKRKHKELFVTEEDLLKPVRLPHVLAAHKGEPAQQGKQQKQLEDGGAGAATHAAPNPKKKQKQQSQEGGDSAVGVAKQKVKATQQQQQQQQAASYQPADQQPRKKKSKNKFKQQQDQPAGPGGLQVTTQKASSAPVASPAEQQQQQQQKPKQQKQEGHNKQQQQQQPPTKQLRQPKAQQQQQQHPVDAPVPGSSSHPKAKAEAKHKRKQQQQEQEQGKQVGLEEQQQHTKRKSGKQQQQQQKYDGQEQNKVKLKGTQPPQQQPQQQRKASQQLQQQQRPSKLLDKMRARLQGGRFRQLNEALYTQPGADAFGMMQQQPELFQQYHDGFKEQVRNWPLQPVDAAIKWLAGLPEDALVADFGCGDAQLAASVKQKVHSLDLVATAPGVIACNMAATPLRAASCDVAVFSLSLMGTDYGSFLEEAHRVLKNNGWLWIAEVRSRFAREGEKEDFTPFLKALSCLGFKLVKQDASNRMFVTMLLRKRGEAGGRAEGVEWPQLRACVYKKR